MRAFWLAIIALLFGCVPALAEDPPAPDHSISEVLPLFAENNCGQHKDPANQLVCGDPELNRAGAKLGSAVQERLARLPDRLAAIEENAEWIRERNLSCGISRQEPLRLENIERAKACLLKETEERIAILRDPNFDCLASNTAAGALVCSDPSLAIAEGELNERVQPLIARLSDSEARNALDEYARWIRERDRKCNLADKENVPLAELAPSTNCLAAFMAGKTAEVEAAKGDPRKIFGRRALALLPNADAVDMCVAQIHSANSCGDFVRVKRVFEIDSEVTEASALVTAEVEMVVLAPFAVCSPIASLCTGTCWDARSGKPHAGQASRESFAVAHHITVEKAFAFDKADEGWRCNVRALTPVDFGIALSGH